MKLPKIPVGKLLTKAAGTLATLAIAGLAMKAQRGVDMLTKRKS